MVYHRRPINICSLHVPSTPGLRTFALVTPSTLMSPFSHLHCSLLLFLLITLSAFSLLALFLLHQPPDIAHGCLLSVPSHCPPPLEQKFHESISFIFSVQLISSAFKWYLAQSEHQKTLVEQRHALVLQLYSPSKSSSYFHSNSVFIKPPN